MVVSAWIPKLYQFIFQFKIMFCCLNTFIDMFLNWNRRIKRKAIYTQRTFTFCLISVFKLLMSSFFQSFKVLCNDVLKGLWASFISNNPILKGPWASFISNYPILKDQWAVYCLKIIGRSLSRRWATCCHQLSDGTQAC